MEVVLFFLCSSPQTSTFLKSITLFIRIFKASGVLEWCIVKHNRWVLMSIYNALVIYMARYYCFCAHNVFSSENQLLLFAENLVE